MANLMDFIEWRGDLSFEEMYFTDIDNAIFAELAYVDFTYVFSMFPNQEAISIKEASKWIFQKISVEELYKKVTVVKTATLMLKELAKTKRYGDLLLMYYYNEIDKETELQFSAITIGMANEKYVSFSGTDDTIVGWKEAFNLSYLEEIPGQVKARDYLLRVAMDTDTLLRIGGHSKGGNLAVYAAVNCPIAIQDRILAVYNNDGPGFIKKFYEKEE